MARPEPAPDVRRCTHIDTAPAGQPATSENTASRPTLRVVRADETPRTHMPPAGQNTAGSHINEAVDAAASHPAVADLPPTIGDAIRNLWPDPDHVRYGLPEQIGSAVVGLAQTVGLALCWLPAHIAFATKTRTLIALTVLAVALFAWAVADLA